MVRFTLLLWLMVHAGDGQRIDLTGSEWSFRGSDPEVAKFAGPAHVPGDIFTDMRNAKLIPDPLIGNNGESLQWIASSNWTYERVFNVDAALLKRSSLVFVSEGLDTVADVLINGLLVATCDNQFRAVVVDVKRVLKAGDNTLTVHFQSPVTYAKRREEQYTLSVGHSVPPSCPLTVQHGQCHANFIRKAQSSFSWDWGPSFPTVGLWKNVFIEPVDYCFFRRISAVPVRAADDGAWSVHVELFLYCAEAVDIAATVRIPELAIRQSVTVRSTGGGPTVVSLNLIVPSGDVQLWWPNGYGAQKLYDVQASLTFPDEKPIMSDIIQIGFRSVRLVQDLVDDKNASKGRTFFFEINDVPVFLKGSNWIPADPFQSRVDKNRLEFLFASMREANMNAVRVWGGGVYESDMFYRLADKAGIMIWQDAMFACALYPTNAEFLSNVGAELVEQVNRLKYHPSIVIWAGNNENEVAIRGHWWREENFPEDAMVKDYVKLYKDTIAPIVREVDFGSRPYVLSSPSNGVETEMEGGVAREPGDPAFGDIHFYDYLNDAWKESTFMIPRCASEYGYQSLPTGATLRQAIGTDDWNYFGSLLLHRQHHIAGNIEMLFMAFSHFAIPGCRAKFAEGRTFHDAYDTLAVCPSNLLNDTSFLDAMIYLSQMHQGIAYQAQTEHYRRWRSDLNGAGLGKTMCALYWQLNDIWAAPSWSSIDHGLRWKATHYFARRFFAPLIVSLYMDETDTLRVTVVSDLTTDVPNATVVIDQLAYSNGFTPVYTYRVKMNIRALSAVGVPLTERVHKKRSVKAQSTDFIIRARLLDSSGSVISPDSVLLPNRLFDVGPDAFGDVTALKVSETGEAGRVKIVLSSKAIAPLVWLEVEDALGWFDDNAFTMTTATKTVVFHSWYGNVTADQVRQALSIVSLKDCWAPSDRPKCSLIGIGSGFVMRLGRISLLLEGQRVTSGRPVASVVIDEAVVGPASAVATANDGQTSSTPTRRRPAVPAVYPLLHSQLALLVSHQ
uniref:Beta-mannosidase n=1 Tax=Plectus sambesii TaxID=2011161 RepID=A0A914W5M2_9BILA